MTLNNFHYSMTLMEQLYGITMQESGVSKLVSVRLEEIGDQYEDSYRLERL